MSRRITVFLFILFILLSSVYFFFRRPTVLLGVAVNESVPSCFIEGKMLSVVQSYVTWHNKSHSDYKFKLFPYAYKDDPKEAMNFFHKKGVTVAIGFPLSTEALQIVDLAEEYKIPILSPSCSTPLLSKKDDWFFRVIRDTEEEIHQNCRLLKYLQAKKVTVYQSPYNEMYTQAFLNDLRKEKDYPVSIVAELFYPDCLDTSCLPENSSEAAFILSEPSRAFWIIQELESLPYDMAIILSWWSWMSDIWELDGSYNIDFYTTSLFCRPFKTEDPFLAFLQKERQIVFSDLVLHTTLCMKLIDQIFTKNTRARGGELQDLLSRPQSIPFCGQNITIDRYGDARSKTYFYRYKDGNMTEVTLE